MASSSRDMIYPEQSYFSYMIYVFTREFHQHRQPRAGIPVQPQLLRNWGHATRVRAQFFFFPRSQKAQVLLKLLGKAEELRAPLSSSSPWAPGIGNKSC